MDAVERVIQREAYTIYQQRVRTGKGGDAKSDWFEARQKIGLINEEEQ